MYRRAALVPYGEARRYIILAQRALAPHGIHYFWVSYIQ